MPDAGDEAPTGGCLWLIRLFQYATISEFCEPVERLTGRKVKAFFSSIDTHDQGNCIESFLLHPQGYDGPSRIEFDQPK